MGDTTRHEAHSCGCEPDDGHYVSLAGPRTIPAGDGFSTDWCFPDPAAIGERTGRGRCSPAVMSGAPGAQPTVCAS